MTARLPALMRSALMVIAALLLMGRYAAAEEIYNFDKNHTEIRFTWSHFGISRQGATFLDYDGSLVYDPADPTKSSLELTIKTPSIFSRVAKFDEHLKSADFFDVAKFPTITFKTTKIEKTGENTGKITGDLTIKGITKPVTLDAKLNFSGQHPISKLPTLGFSASTTVKRSDFDLGKFAPAVSDEVLIQIETEMNKKA